MAGISFGGLGNGIDFQQVVSQLVAVEQVPIDQLSQDQKTLQTRLTDYGTLDSDLLKLQSAASSLQRASGFDRFSVSVGDDTLLSATASSDATPGNYTLQITQLATAHQIASKVSKTVSSTTSSIVSGSSATFSFQVGGGTTQTVTLSNGATLDDLKTAINDLGAGVSASVLNTGTSTSPAYRLLLTSTDTGAASAISVTADSTDLDFLNSTGTGGTDTLQAAQDATVVLGDPTGTTVTIQRSSNTITDAIAGVTLSLKSTTAAGKTVNVAVGRDLASITTDIKALVSAYNDVVKFIGSRDTYDTDTKQGGVFFAEGTPQTVLSRLRQAMSDEVSGLSNLTSVGLLGFQTQRDGTITIDDTKLQGALSTNYTDVQNLFAGQPSSTGVAQRISDAIDALDDVSSGALTLRKASLSQQISDMGDQIRQKQDALSAYQERLQLQYAQLDALLRQMQGQMDYLKQL